MNRVFPSLKVETRTNQKSVWLSVLHDEAFQSGGGQQYQSPSATPASAMKTVVCADQFLAVPIGSSTPEDLDHKWLPDKENYPVIDVCLGVGLGYRWYGHATFDSLRKVADELKLEEGESFKIVSIRALRNGNFRNVGPATDYLLGQKDGAVEILREAAPNLRLAIGVLAAIHTPKAIDALVQLHGTPNLKSDVELALASGKVTPNAKSIYEAGIANEDAAPYCASAALKLDWREMIPRIQHAYAGAQSYYTALELLNTLTKFKTGSDLPSFDKVHNYFGGWTPHDDRAVLAASNRDYAPLCIAKMISVATKGGNPFAKTGVNLAKSLVQSGRASDLQRILNKYNLSARLAQLQKSFE